MHLVLGDEELLVERAVADVLRSARQRAGTADVPVSRMRAGDVGAYELAELLSPSLFAEERIVVLGAAAEAGKDAAAVIESAAADLPAGTVLVVVHSGGGRAKSLANQLRSMGAQVHPCARITKVSERADFIRSEFASLRVKVDDETVTALLDAVGSDVRELASACSQLVADTGGAVDAAAVRRYHSGKAEVRGFDIADKAVAGDVAGAAEALRWAMMRGEPLVVLADALGRNDFGRIRIRRSRLRGGVHRVIGQPVCIRVPGTRNPLVVDPAKLGRQRLSLDIELQQIRVLDLPPPGHLLHHQLGVHQHRGLGGT